MVAVVHIKCMFRKGEEVSTNVDGVFYRVEPHMPLYHYVVHLKK